MSLSHNCATKLVTMGRPKFTPKLPLLLRRSPPHLIHSSLDRTHSPSETASGSNQPSCHSTLSGPTDRHTHRPTDGLGDRSTPLTLTLAILIERDALEIMSQYFAPQPGANMSILIKQYQLRAPVEASGGHFKPQVDMDMVDGRGRLDITVCRN